MGDRLALARVARLSSRGLYRYLSPLLREPPLSITTDVYLRTLFRHLAADPGQPLPLRLAAGDLEAVLSVISGSGSEADSDGLPAATLDPILSRRVQILQEALAAAAGVEPPSYPEPGGTRVERAPAEGAPTRQGAEPGHPVSEAVPVAASLPVVIWVPHIRSPFNLGNILRTAAAYGVRGVAVGESAPDLDHPRVRRAAMGGGQMVPVLRGGPEHFSGTEGMPVIALETGGTRIDDFPFPEEGVLVVGHEELGVPEETLARASREHRVVTIPHFGEKSSLNVGVAAGIALSWWLSRRQR
jgi:tRNA(Leu) C34 or U34 (ribose-2'-O)-methylase TrmL